MKEIKRATQSEIFDFALKYFPNFRISDSPFSRVFVYLIDGEIVGFILYSVIYDKAEIEYFALKEEYRGKGISQELFDYLLSDLENCNVLSLEVNCNNERAINFYKKNGFQVVSVRKKYYGDIDGYLMIRKVGD